MALFLMFKLYFYTQMGFPGGSVVKNGSMNAEDAGGMGSVPGLGYGCYKLVKTHLEQGLIVA